MSKNRPPTIFTKNFFSLIAVFALLVTTFATGQVALQPAVAAGPGESVTITEGGNTFTFSLTTLSDGTGHGTTSQCFINSDNGYAVGDNTPTDGYFCLYDTVTYRMDWSADVTNPNMTVDFRFNNTYTGPGPIFPMTGNIRWGWDGGGITGGPSIGFTGAGWGSGSTRGGARMTFTSTGTRAGFWTFTVKQEEVRGTLDLAGDISINGVLKDTVQTDRQVTHLGHPRHDLIHNSRVADAVLTTVDGVAYQGLTIRSNLHPTVGGPERTQYPGYHPDKGYFGRYGQRGWFPLQDVRWSLVDAPEGTLAQINGGEPVSVQWDGANAYVLAHQQSEVKFLIPWESLNLGVNSITTRIDPMDRLIPQAGLINFEGSIDPGVGLACSVSTSGILPGARGGSAGLPNNNCGLTVIDRSEGEGTFRKEITHDRERVQIDGSTTDPRGREAQGGSGSQPDTEKTYFNTNLHFSPPPSTVPSEDLAVCDVWDNTQAGLTGTNNFTANGVALHTLIPTAQVYYTTQDLRPEGAPWHGSQDALPEDSDIPPPSCGSPSDPAWSLTPPSNLATVAGVMVVIPGENALVNDVHLKIPMRVTHASNFENATTPNVRDYMGYTFDSSIDEPVWAGDSDHITVYSARLSAWGTYEAQTSLPIGKVTYTTTAGQRFNWGGVFPQGTLLTKRVYLDNCMLNPTVEVGSGTAPISYTFVEGVQDPTRCGELSTSYYEAVYSYDVTQNLAPLLITWTTPIDSRPGDTYQMNSTWSVNEADLEGNFVTSPTGYPKTYTVSPSASIGSVKFSNNDVVEVNQPFSHTVGWYNYSPATAGETTFIDVLPWNGDSRGTDFTGTFALDRVVQQPGDEALTSVEYTNKAPNTVVNDPEDASNLPGGSTVWCAVDEFGSPGCPETMAEVTALKFDTSDFKANLAQYFTLHFVAEGNEADDIYHNSLSTGYSRVLSEAVPEPAPVNTRVVDSSIAGTVFVDSNYSASMEDSEERLEGYTVQLLDANGNVIATTETDAEGNYLFPNLTSGNYQVRVLNPGPYTVITVAGTDIEEDAADGTTQVLNLGVDQDMTNVNAGLYGYTTINGTVYYDGNASAEQDATELGVEGVTLTLRNEANEVVATIVTDENGFYEFSDLAPGIYTVEMTTPEGHTVTQVWDVRDAEGITETETAPIDAPVNGAVTEVDFGIFEPALISGVVYADTNGDGDQNNGETGVPGVTITLKDDTGATVAVVETGEDGSYEFDNLPPGTYVVEMTTPDGPIVTQVWETSNPGGVPGTEDTATTEDIVAPGGSETTDVDFGLYTAVTISGTVYEDYNRDGDQDTNEPGREGWPVTLTLPDGSTVDTTTDENGYYEFIDLVPGTYTVTIQDPETGEVLTQSYTAVDPTGTETSPAQPVSVVAADVTDVDFGIFTPLEISGYVYWDADYSTNRDEGESGIADITLTLTDGAGNELATTTTGADGFYEFTNLDPGVYEVVFTTPEGLIQTQMYEVKDANGVPPVNGESVSGDLDLVNNDITDVNFGFNVDPGPGGSDTPPTPVFESGM